MSSKEIQSEIETILTKPLCELVDLHPEIKDQVYGLSMLNVSMPVTKQLDLPGAEIIKARIESKVLNQEAKRIQFFLAERVLHQAKQQLLNDWECLLEGLTKDFAMSNASLAHLAVDPDMLIAQSTQAYKKAVRSKKILCKDLSALICLHRQGSPL